VCTFLSGGLDSSAISAIAAADFKERGKRLTTYSIDYEGNDKYFKASLFQPTSDQYFAERMAKFIDSDHKTVLLKQEDLAHSLRESTFSRDLPGMADVDSSLLLFCKEIRKDFVVGLSGECADELFAGYPWFTNEEMINANTFPWSRSVGERKTILNDNIKNIKIEELTNEEYFKTLKQVPHLDNEDKKTYRMRELFYLNLKWFMVNLLNRKDRASMYNSLEVRVPFADYRIVDYAFNLPVDVKLLDGREKGLLRKALVGILPNEIIYRKKSPYPKTHNPIYTKIVCGMMNEILNDKTSPILQIINKDKVQEIVNTKGDSYKTPWFGQLMTGPQMIAYLIQVDTWLREYNVNILI
ncbi:MAG: asparagine synthase C-terminal domain-containing protein, partial [Clostridium celatum]|nr:asparagine synthase C-terminal domain-containing protein [Clostridium celatum]